METSLYFNAMISSSAEGQVLVVHRAHFGRQDKTTCSLGRSALCQTYDDLLFICIHRCSGKNNCSLSATSSVFGDPCIGTYKYLEVDYTCQCNLTCEGFQANLQCGEGQIIVVHGAHYGRHDKTTCSAGRPASQLQVVTCSSQSSTDVVAKSCNGKKSCTIPATNSVFGDPCVGTYKYMQVVYTCQCKGQVLVIHRADYGRRDKITCSAGRPASQLQLETILNIYSPFNCIYSCNGKSSCTISASNSVFGDPCVGTYKYLGVVYACYCKYFKW
uniref:SUEL-type lectin domain-containing protein n=1 Tax=Oreochromis aureus TaxID=47969 RepID=A0A668U6D7_OREAU